MGAKVVHEKRRALSFYIETPIAMKSAQTARDRLEFRFGPCALLSVQSFHKGVDIFPAVVTRTNFGHTPLIAFLAEAKRGLDLRDNNGGTPHRRDLLDSNGIARQVDSCKMGN
jgi:hypothetical protein